jgi:hypothetical protein
VTHRVKPMTAPKTGRGGARPGSGRKRAGDLRDATLAGVSITRAKLEAYKQIAAQRGVTLTELVETSVDMEIDNPRLISS